MVTCTIGIVRKGGGEFKQKSDVQKRKTPNKKTFLSRTTQQQDFTE